MPSRIRRPIILALAGPSGSGKSTASRALARMPGWSHLAEAYDRIEPRPSLEPGSQPALLRLELRLLAEEARRYAAARRLQREGLSVVCDTSFLDPIAYTAGLYAAGEASHAVLRSVIRRAVALVDQGRLGPPDLTVYLVTSASTRRSRASRDPARHPVALRPRHERIGRFDAREVRALLGTVAPGRVARVQASGPLEVTVSRLRRLAERTTPLDAPTIVAWRLLRRLARVRSRRPTDGRSGKLKKGTPSPPAPR